MRKDCRIEILNKHSHVTTHSTALFEYINNLQKLSLFYTAIENMYLKRTPYNYISRKASTNFRYSISNIRITLAEKSEKDCGSGKKCFDLILERRIIHTCVWKEKGKTIKQNAECLNGEG